MKYPENYVPFWLQTLPVGLHRLRDIVTHAQKDKSNVVKNLKRLNVTAFQGDQIKSNMCETLYQWGGLQEFHHLLPEPKPKPQLAPSETKDDDGIAELTETPSESVIFIN